MGPVSSVGANFKELKSMGVDTHLAYRVQTPHHQCHMWPLSQLKIIHTTGLSYTTLVRRIETRRKSGIPNIF